MPAAAPFPTCPGNNPQTAHSPGDKAGCPGFPKAPFQPRQRFAGRPRCWLRIQLAWIVPGRVHCSRGGTKPAHCSFMELTIILPDDFLKRIADEVASRLAYDYRASLTTSMVIAYDPTRRLSRKDAAKHLGITARTLDGWAQSGRAIKHTSTGERPYFLIGELDGAQMPAAYVSVAGVKRRARRARQEPPAVRISPAPTQRPPTEQSAVFTLSSNADVKQPAVHRPKQSKRDKILPLLNDEKAKTPEEEAAERAAKKLKARQEVISLLVEAALSGILPNEEGEKPKGPKPRKK